MSILARGSAARVRRDPPDVEVGALFDEHAPMVLAICRYLLRDPQAAEDAAQETFLSAHRSLLRGTEPRDPPAWLAMIARNECRRAWRRPRPVPLDDGRTGTLLDPADIVADRADLNAVASAIGKLPPRQREALVLREFCGLSYEQVATAMSVSLPVVDSLLSRARRRLTERVGYIPKAARGALVVPASLREELARLIPGLDPAGAATAASVASGTGGAAALVSLGSAPVAVKVAATGAAAVAVALPVQATLRGDEGRPQPRRPVAVQQVERHAAAPPAPARVALPAPRPPAARPQRRRTNVAASRAERSEPARETERRDHSGPSPSSGPGSTGADQSSSGPGPGPPPPPAIDQDAPGSLNSGPGSSASGSSGPPPPVVTVPVDNSGPGSVSSGSGSSGSGSSESGSGSSGSGSSGSGSESSGSGSSGSGSGGSGSGGSDSDDDD